jgi:tetratricopeptide (TPR) repeat protein
LTNTEQAITDFDVIISLPETPIELRVLSLIGRAHAYIELGKFDEASADLDTIFYLPNVPEAQIKLAQAGMEIAHKIADLKCAEQNFDTYFSGSEVPLITRIDAKLDLAQIRIMTGRWDAALSTLAEGLALGAKENIPMLGRENERGEHGSESFLVYAGNSLAIIAAFFTSSLAPTIRRERAAELLRIYAAHDALTALGEALTRHLGVMYRAAEGLPAADNLELWATAWEDAGRDQEAFRLPLRIFRTGIDFLKAGGKDHGILLDLNQEERKILQQALDLE